MLLTAARACCLLSAALMLTAGGAPNGDGCGYTFFGPESGTFTSKNYPNTYPNNTVCEWKIQVKPGERILLKFGDFDIEDVDSCHSSYLRISDGSGSSRTDLGAKYCGLALKPEDVESKSHEVTVTFMSGIHISGRGFLASYATANKTDLITCLEKASWFSEPEYRKFCPAGCLTPFGEISGTIPVGYRDSSLLCMAGIHAGVVSNALGGPISVVVSNGIAGYGTAQANNVTSKEGPLSSTLFTFKTSGCYGHLGMINGAIPDSQVMASSVLEKEEHGQINKWRPERGRLKKQGLAWAASFSDEHPWLQIDLNKLTKVAGVITTGTLLSTYNYYVTAYRIEHSDDGLKWAAYREPHVDRDKVFQANSDNEHEVRNNLIPPIVTRFVRIRPSSWSQHVAMKVELLGCQYIPAPVPKLTAPPVLVPRAKHNPMPVDKTTPPPEVRNTTVTPGISRDVPLAAILVPALVMVCTSIVVLLVCAWHWRNRKKKAEGTYDLPYWDRAGWWKGMKQFLPAKSAEHEETSVRYSSCEVSRLRPREMTSMSAEYAQPLVGGAVGTLLHQRSTFKPEEGKEGGYADLDSYNSPDTDIYHAYAEPLPTSGPEYATPIIMDMSAHPAGTICLPSTSTFKGAGSQAPVLVGTYKQLVSRTDGSSSTQVLYDTPKVTPAAEETVYQVPQPAANKDVAPEV